MSAVTPEEFLALLKRSDLLEDEAYSKALTDIKSEIPNVFSDVNQLADEYIKRDLLTTWHVRQLLKRKYKGFYLRQYKILGHLGSGGMSSVYLAEHTIMRRRVAIKVLPKRRLNPVYLDRFAREAQAIASLDSQHVVRAYDVDRFEDVHYIVMEYFEGQNLRQLVEKEGPLDYEDAATYIRQAALGLSDAHKRGIVHRDVKPDNIVVDERGFVKVLDLGLALLDEGTFTLQGTVCDEDKILGTADYLAPEQALDSHNVDARADIYGLGATLYFCLVGKPPFPFGTISERLLAHQRKEPASIFIERPDAPTDLVEICSCMMAKKVEHRIQTTEEVADVMRRWLIKHGFAQQSDFSSENSDNVRPLPVLDGEHDFLPANNLATEIGFERNTESFRLSDAELHDFAQRNTENVVDLYDVVDGETSGSKFRSSKSSRDSSSFRQSNNMVLSQDNSLSGIDPLELVLNEIEDASKVRSALGTSSSLPNGSNNTVVPLQETNPIITSKFQRSTQAKQCYDPSNRSQSNQQVLNTHTQENVASPQPTTLFEHRRSSAITNSVTVDSENDRFGQFFGDWYRTVPIWFWTVAIGGYALAIFLAGILFTILLHLK